MSATDDVERMLTLVPWLLERQDIHLAEVADAFGVDVATIRSHLEHLDFCGLPGYGGGDLFDVTIVEDHVQVRMADELKRPMRPRPAQALRLVLTLDAVADALGDEVPALHSAMGKVRRALGISAQAADVVESAGPGSLRRARAAIADGRQVRLRYQGRADQAPTERLVDPWVLHVADDSWYLQGWDHRAGAPRAFRFDRLVELEVTATPATVAAPKVVEPPRYVPGPGDMHVVLEVTPWGRWLEDALDVDAVDPVEDGETGRVRLRFRTDAPHWIARLVVMAAGEAQVVEPAGLRDLVARRAQEALRHYQAV